MLIKNGADCNKSNKSGRTPLDAAFLNGHGDVVKLLIKSGAKYNESDKRGNNLLHATAKNGHTVTVDLLIKYGANCNQSNGNGSTPLLAASGDGHSEVVELLIKSGADLNKSDRAGRTPLFVASWAGHEDVVDILVKVGADCNKSDEDGRTPLHVAAMAGNGERMDMPINSCRDRKTEFLFKFLEDNSPCRDDLLFNPDADKFTRQAVSHDCSNDFSASISGINSKYESVVRSLIRSGADINHYDLNGECPLSIARKYEEHTIADILMEHGAESSLTE